MVFVITYGLWCLLVVWICTFVFCFVGLGGLLICTFMGLWCFIVVTMLGFYVEWYVHDWYCLLRGVFGLASFGCVTWGVIVWLGS